MQFPDWVNYATIKSAIIDFGGPYAEWVGLSLLVVLVLGVAVRWVIVPLRRR